jgi:ribosomal protein S18 acetylase RimI-like enzyme
MIVRDYRPGDYPSIEALWKETGIYRSERGDSPETIQSCNALGGKFLILEDESKNNIVGTSWLTWDGRRVHLQYLAVLPSQQGLAYGRKLAEESMAFTRNKGASVKLEVHRDNIPAIELYLSMGFKILEGYEVYLVYYEA